MKVLLVTRKAPPPTNLGAVPTIVGAVAEGLADAGVEVMLVAGPLSRPRVQAPRDRLVIYRIDDESHRALDALSKIRRLWKDADILHVHDVLPLGTGFLNWMGQSPAPRFWTIHNFSAICTNSFLWPPCSLTRERLPSGAPDLCYIDRSPDCRRCFHQGSLGWARHVMFKLECHLARRGAYRFHLITPSSAAAKIITKSWGLRPSVLSNPIAFAGSKALGTHSGVLDLFFGGRLVPEKGVDVLIKGIGQLRDTGTSLTLSGTGRPAYLAALRDLAQRLGVEYKQECWRPRNEYMLSLREHDICIVPTTGFEVFGMSVLDAEAAGLPLVLADQGGLREVARNGKNALYFRRGDAESLANAIRSLATDPSMRRRFALRSAKVVERFRLDQHVKALLKLYDDAMLP